MVARFQSPRFSLMSIELSFTFTCIPPGLAQAGGPGSSIQGPDIPAATAALLLALIAWPAMLYGLTKLGLRWFPKSDDGEPKCGGCGYLVRGLSMLQCPECGGDLRVVGITRTVPAGLWWTVIAWTVLVYAGAMVAIGLVFAAFYLLTGKGVTPASAFVPTLVCVCYAAAWALGLLVITRTHRKPSRMPATTAAASDPPADEATSRVLAIMFIDMHGYTARTGQSSRDGLIALIRQVRELVRPTAAQHGGRIVKTMGDGLLVTFDSPTNAVIAGREIQSLVRARAKVNASDAIELRIGVSIGEVALENDDVYGEPVNLASRIQQLAHPGEVYFSEAVRHAMTRSEVPHEAVGEFEIKGFDGAVKLYRALNGKA